MRCVDDCHTYWLENLVRGLNTLTFYHIGVHGEEIPGTTNEEVLRVLIHRLKFLNDQWMDGKFKSRENSIAITKLEEALWTILLI